MSSTSFPASAASLSDSNEPGCEPSRSVRSSHSAGASSPSTGQASPATTTCEVLPLTNSEQMELLPMSSVVASPAKTSAWPGDRRDWTAPEADYGAKSPVSLANFDPATRSWRTSQISLLALASSQAGGLELFSETWPRSGMMQNGIAFQLAPLVPRTREIGSGLWQTPVADDAVERTAGKFNSRGEPKLSAQVKLWPTPAAMDTGLTTDLKKIEARRQAIKAKRINGNGFGPSLGEMVRLFPTPTTQDASNNGGASQYERNSLPLNALVGGALNPPWVEWLMGFPIEWTASPPSEMQSSPKSPKSSVARSSKAKRSLNPKLRRRS